MTDPLNRFTSTVDYYAQYRPNYPMAVLELLQTKCGLTENSIIADIGAGTGIFTRLLAKMGCLVYAVEPNAAMAAKIINDQKDQRIIAVNASGEATTLAEHSIDIITAATAFHWLNKDLAKQEFKRILKPNAWVVLVWNIRQHKASDFMQAYENLLLKYGTDYQKVAAEHQPEDEIKQFFAPNQVYSQEFPNQQIFDAEGFKGRLLSTSYTPKPDQPNYQPMVKAAEDIFQQHHQSQQVHFIYTTKVYYGQLS